VGAAVTPDNRIDDARLRGRILRDSVPIEHIDAPTMCVVDEIAPERELADGVKYEKSLAERWAALTAPLPLEGGAAMAETADGGVLLASQLRARAPWHDRLAEIVEEDCRLSLAVGQPWLRLQPLLLVGPPGTGKSYWAHLLARLSGCGTGTLDMAGSSDSRTLEGTARGWTNAIPAWPLTVIDAVRTANPVLVVDEIEKAGGSDRHGWPLDALLGMLEPSTAARYYDRCLLGRADLSQCSWIATANSLDGLPRPLLSRLRVIEVSGPEAHHADAVIDAVLADLARSWHLSPDMLPVLPGSTRRILRDGLAETGSVRLLARQLRTAMAALMTQRGRGRLT